MNGQDRFWQLAGELQAEDRRIRLGTIMSSRCLRVADEFLALYDPKRGGAVVKLPKTRVAELIAAVGPHIEGCCFEVGADVAAEIARAAPAGPSPVIDKKPRPHVDLRAVIERQAVHKATGQFYKRERHSGTDGHHRQERPQPLPQRLGTAQIGQVEQRPTQRCIDSTKRFPVRFGRLGDVR